MVPFVIEKCMRSVTSIRGNYRILVYQGFDQGQTAFFTIYNSISAHGIDTDSRHLGTIKVVCLSRQII